MKSENTIQNLSFRFALDCISLYKEMLDQKEYVLSKQLLRSGTSIGANIEEAGAAISKKDFILKMSIASKEARETKYWLLLIKESKIVSINVELHLLKIEHIINVITKIVKTSQENLK